MKSQKIFVAAASILAGFLSSLPSSLAQTWVSNNVPIQQWSSLASSADGARLVATVFGGGMYASTNSGATWTTNGAAANSWVSVASSADGLKLAAVGNGNIFVSTNFGATWKQSATPVATFKEVASSADGTRLFAGSFPGYCLYSTNSGTNWSVLTNLPSTYWSSVACAGNGTTLVAVQSIDDLPVYVSTNAGASWTGYFHLIGQPGAGAAASADGGKLFVISYGFVYMSTNAGVSWSARANAGAGNSLACSADGTQLFTACRTQPALSDSYSYTVWFSTNSGGSWMTNVIANAVTNTYASVMPVATSADGTQLAFANGDTSGVYTLGGHFGPIYTFQTIPSPQLNIAPAGTNLLLSWILPATNFVMQQSADLSAWADVTNPPVLNMTNLQNQVVLPAGANPVFFRLGTP